MRIFSLFFIMCLSVMALESYSIEVLCVKDKSEISDAFMDKVNATELSFTTHHAKGKYRVLVGDFRSIKAAENELSKVKEIVSQTAFITTGMDVVEINPKEKMIQAMVMAQARALKSPKKESGKEIPKSVETEDVIVNKTKTLKRVNKEEKVKKEKVEVICASSKQALREVQIANALNFYKNSSYYRFSN